jgi:hypothetical protein
MLAGAVATFRRALGRPEERVFRRVLMVITVLGAWSRAGGLSNGALFRDDAWVALTHRVGISTAWHMVGTAPGFVMFERYWTALTAPSTLWAQLPIFVFSLVSIPLIAATARWFGLKRWTALLCAVLIAVSKIDVQYATHLKPYASDVLCALGVLIAAEWWRRGHSPWPFAGAALVAVGLSFTVAPLVLGASGVVVYEAYRHKRVRSLLVPGTVSFVALSLLYLSVRSGISPRLRQSWAPNFVQYGSLHAVTHSVWNVTSGLVAGFSDTTPHWHVVGLSKLIIAFVVMSAIWGAVRNRGRLSAPWTAALFAAVVLAAAHVEPLGTGRTDAYLYPALALLVASGSEGALLWLQQRHVVLARIGVGALCVFSIFTLADRTVHLAKYPGGSFVPVQQAASTELANAGGSVLIEGTARWPWTYYEARHVRLIFSNRYNTGFAPLSDNKRVVVMAGTVIEGGYNPSSAVGKLSRFRSTLYVRTDDWPSLGDPVARAFALNYWHVTRQKHVPGYLLEWLSHS